MLKGGGRPYVGVDILQSDVKHRFYNRVDGDDMDGNKTKSSSKNFGVNAGYKMNFDKVFVAPEIFYDHFNSSAKDFDSNDPQYAADRIEIDSRYGAKVNLGYNFCPKLSGFINAGMANVKHNVRWNSQGKSDGDSKLAMIYGLGLSYALNDNWSLRTSYDRQTFNIRYMENGLRDKVRLDVVKFGVIYGF